jgi:hypothetical protein
VQLSPVRNNRYGKGATAAPYAAIAFDLKGPTAILQETKE